MLSVYLKCVSQFFQWIKIVNKEFVSNFAMQMEKNIIWALWSVWERKLGEKGLICRKKIHEFCTTITYYLKAIIVNEFLAKNSMSIIEQPPYSPDMAPADFFLFPKNQITTSRLPFSTDWRHKREFVARTEVDSGKCV